MPGDRQHDGQGEWTWRVLFAAQINLEATEANVVVDQGDDRLNLDLIVVGLFKVVVAEDQFLEGGET